MKISEDVLKHKGIAYIQKYPYSDLSKVSKNGKTIMKVPFDEHPYTAFARFLKTDNGVDVMKAIQKKLT